MVHTHDEAGLTEALVKTKMDLALAQAELEQLQMEARHNADEIAERNELIISLQAQLQAK